MHPSITQAFINNINNAVSSGDTDELYDSYCDGYRDAHGIKARWVYGVAYTAEDWVRMFSALAYDMDQAIEREEEANAAFRERVASLGLTEWAERNNIRSEVDLMEHNYYSQNYMHEVA